MEFDARPFFKGRFSQRMEGVEMLRPLSLRGSPRGREGFALCNQVGKRAAISDGFVWCDCRKKIHEILREWNKFTSPLS